MDTVRVNSTEAGIAKIYWYVIAGTVVMMLSVTVACAPDYVYVQRGKSEADIHMDYVACAEQQQMQKVRSTSDCMEDKGYHAMKIEPASHSDRTRAADVSPASRSSVQ